MDSLWRLSVPPATSTIALEGEWFIEWNGAQRWLISNNSATEIRDTISDLGGHASLFRSSNRDGEIFHPLNKTVMQLQQNIKQAFDPYGIFNPGRMYAEI